MYAVPTSFTFVVLLSDRTGRMYVVVLVVGFVEPRLPVEPIVPVVVALYALDVHQTLAVPPDSFATRAVLEVVVPLYFFSTVVIAPELLTALYGGQYTFLVIVAFDVADPSLITIVTSESANNAF